MKKNLKNLPESTESITASTKLVELYEQETAYILAALGEINEDFKYAILTDETIFRDFNLTTAELISVAKIIGINLMEEDKLVLRAKELRRQTAKTSQFNYSLDT